MLRVFNWLLFSISVCHIWCTFPPAVRAFTGVLLGCLCVIFLATRWFCRLHEREVIIIPLAVSVPVSAFGKVGGKHQIWSRFQGSAPTLSTPNANV